MSGTADLVIVGAGPAGLAAAAAGADAGIDVTLIDDQPEAGGQIYRGVAAAGAERRRVLGADYVRGVDLADAANRHGVDHLAGASVWQVTPDRQVHFTRAGTGHVLAARHLVLATGALERAMPFPGWTLPGVMTAGAGQILLKASGLVPREPVVLAGSGPLLFLLACQYLRAGATLAAVVETTPGENWRRALPLLPAALTDAGVLAKGLALIRQIRRHGVPYFKGARGLAAIGEGGVEALSFTAGGRARRLPCRLLLVHQGVVPNVQITRAMGLAHVWDERQRCWRPRLRTFGRSEADGVSVAGDGGGIAGAQAAAHQGRLAGLDAARRLGAIDDQPFLEASRQVERLLARVARTRPFLDALYAPSREFLAPGDDVVVCRCEEVTAGAIRGYVRLGCLGPNQTKAFGRPGMGPCQGRVCGLTVSEIIAAARNRPVTEIGHYRVRFPVRPVTLGEVAGKRSGPADRTGDSRA